MSEQNKPQTNKMPEGELQVDAVVSVEKIEIQFNENKLSLLTDEQRQDLITIAFLECSALLKTGMVDIDIDDPKKIVISKR